VYETIQACGLDGYYKLRDAADVEFKPVTPVESGLGQFDSPAFQSLYVRKDDSTQLSTVDLILEGVTCAACVWLVEKLPRVLDGVVDARLSLRGATVRVTWDERRVKLSRIAQTLARFGYIPHPAKGVSRAQIHRKEERKRLIHLAAAGAIMGNTMLLAVAQYAGDFGHMDASFRTFFRWFSVALGAISLAWPGATFFTSALRSIRNRAVNLDVPIALALLVGGVAGIVNVLLGRGDIYFDSLTVLVFLLLVGRYLQFRQQRKADDAVELLFSLTPSSCRIVQTDDEVLDAPIEALKVDDVVEVRGGDLLPADGVVTRGVSSVDQALLTGESVPVEVSVGSNVFGGSQNVGGSMRVRVTHLGESTRVGKLMRLIERGVTDKPPIVQFADRVGAIFTVVVTLVSAGTFAWWSYFGTTGQAIDHTVALLIVTCPCVLGLATPLTIAVAIGNLARDGVLVKSGAVIEKLSRGGRVILDKTGTITAGRLQVVNWVGDEQIRPIVAQLERRSSHPVARALAEFDDPGAAGLVGDIVDAGDGGVRAGLSDGRLMRVGSARYSAVNGVVLSDELDTSRRFMEGDGLTTVVVSINARAVAVVGLGDRVRDDSAAAIAALRGLGLRPEVLSGDASAVVERVAISVGIEACDARGDQSPEAKLAEVCRTERAAGRGRMTVVVGDGVNDAAALAAADVGIAVHGGAEASLAAADVYVARPGLSPVVDLVRMSRRTMRTIHRNLGVSLAYNLLAGVLAAGGVMNPMFAAILMPLSSATVLSLAVAGVRRRKR